MEFMEGRSVSDSLTPSAPIEPQKGNLSCHTHLSFLQSPFFALSHYQEIGGLLKIMTCFDATNNPGSENGLFGGTVVRMWYCQHYKWIEKSHQRRASGEHGGVCSLLVFDVVVVVIWVRTIGCSPQQDLKRLPWPFRGCCVLEGQWHPQCPPFSFLHLDVFQMGSSRVPIRIKTHFQNTSLCFSRKWVITNIVFQMHTLHGQILLTTVLAMRLNGHYLYAKVNDCVRKINSLTYSLREKPKKAEAGGNYCCHMFSPAGKHWMLFAQIVLNNQV